MTAPFCQLPACSISWIKRDTILAWTRDCLTPLICRIPAQITLSKLHPCSPLRTPTSLGGCLLDPVVRATVYAQNSLFHFALRLPDPSKPYPASRRATMPDRSAPIWGVGIAFFVLTWIAVGLRIFVRAGMIKSFGRDDWTMLGTQLLNTAYLASQLGGLVYGTGRHLEDLEPERAEKALSVCETDDPIVSGVHHANILDSTGFSARSSTS